jgi:hypothetical protein
MSLIDFWLLQSDTVKGAVLGAGVAMVGVIINGLVSGWNTSRQLKHDREQRATERSISLRRDIYLGVAEHLQGSLLALQKLADLGLEVREIVDLQLRSAHFVAKLHLMGKPKLIESVALASKQLVAANFRVRLARDVLIAQNEKLKQLRARIEGHRKAAADAMAVFKSNALQRPPTAGETDRLAGIFKSESDEAERLAREHDTLFLDFKAKSAELWHKALTEQFSLYPQIISVAAAAREELGEEIDTSVYSRAMAVQPPPDLQLIRAFFGLKDAVSAQTVPT